MNIVTHACRLVGRVIPFSCDCWQREWLFISSCEGFLCGWVYTGSLECWQDRWVKSSIRTVLNHILVWCNKFYIISNQKNWSFILEYTYFSAWRGERIEVEEARSDAALKAQLEWSVCRKNAFVIQVQVALSTYWLIQLMGKQYSRQKRRDQYDALSYAESRPAPIPLHPLPEMNNQRRISSWSPVPILVLTTHFLRNLITSPISPKWPFIRRYYN